MLTTKTYLEAHADQNAWNILGSILRPKYVTGDDSSHSASEDH